MSQPIYQQPNPKIIETLKAARNQVVQVGKSRNEGEQEVVAASAVGVAQKSGKGFVEILVTGQTQLAARSNFAEEFVQKLTSIEQETAAVDEEISKLEKIWLNLPEKKKQLESRRKELAQIHNKITELDKEADNILNSKIIENFEF